MDIYFTKPALKDIAKAFKDDQQSIIDEISKAFEDGSFLAESESVDLEKMKDEEPDLYKLLMLGLKELENEDKPN